MTKFYIDSRGKYIGGFDGSIPENATEVSFPPSDARMTWDGEKWIEPAAMKEAILQNKRWVEYRKEGVTEEAMIVALWETIVENRPSAVNDLQVKRMAVKLKYPKD